MYCQKIINFRKVSLRIEKPTAASITNIFNSFGYERFKNREALGSSLVVANNSYDNNDYFQYVIYYENTAIGFLKMEQINTKRGKPLNGGLRFNESRVFKMNLVLGDIYVKTALISEIIFCILSNSNFDKGILFATQSNDNRFKKALKNNLFKDIITCKYDEIVSNTENGSECKFYFFKAEKDDFALANKYASKNRTAIHQMYNPLFK